MFAAWSIILLEEVLDWYDVLADEDTETAELVGAAFDLLAQVGPSLGRPLVDSIAGSRIGTSRNCDQHRHRGRRFEFCSYSILNDRPLFSSLATRLDGGVAGTGRTFQSPSCATRSGSRADMTRRCDEQVSHMGKRPRRARCQQPHRRGPAG